MIGSYILCICIWTMHIVPCSFCWSQKVVLKTNIPHGLFSSKTYKIKDTWGEPSRTGQSPVIIDTMSTTSKSLPKLRSQVWGTTIFGLCFSKVRFLFSKLGHTQTHTMTNQTSGLNLTNHIFEDVVYLALSQGEILHCQSPKVIILL